ncbi:EsaB/YukD family protein [Streptomyces oryzae]|uniref:EsaB/YukD family protein n=1 Tax=Streptomyces oryzae TaxID=1434886 RepID=A0ABS3X5H3_9ACTN|nr:EsaB/YukD family protein [Streptomyces oryzae]MBO8190326.1 EsaB/YukD family protein [Streptomyces oryzae]
MSDERCRVTVIGGRKSVDLALPTRTPIAEYAPRLAGMCGAEESEALPAVWSLATAEAAPFAPGDSLEEAGVLDGTVLYLRDCRAEENYDLTVTDLDDQIAAANEDSASWGARHRAQAVVAAGLGACAVAAGTLAVRQEAGLGSVLFWVAGLGSALTAWYATRKSWPVSAAMRQVMALAACPLLAFAGLGGPLHGEVATPVATSVSATAGALAGLVALPAISTVVLQLVTTLAMVLVVPLSVLGADRTGAAAVTTAALLPLIRALPRITSQIAVIAPGDSGARGTTESEEVAAAVRRGNLLLTFLTVLFCTALAGSLVALAVSRDAYALGLLGCASVALLLDAGASRLLSVVGPQLAVAALGLTALAMRVPEVMSPTGASAGLAVFAAGLVLAAWGLGMAFRAVARPGTFADRPRWLSTWASFFIVVCVPLAVGVFGVFERLASAGSSM